MVFPIWLLCERSEPPLLFVRSHLSKIKGLFGIVFSIFLFFNFYFF